MFFLKVFLPSLKLQRPTKHMILVLEYLESSHRIIWHVRECCIQHDAGMGQSMLVKGHLGR